MSKRALVLGGGGTVGIAWETGVVAGLRRAGVHVGNAERIVGTSAGSVVGARLALGNDPEALLAEQLAPLSPIEQQPLPIDAPSFGAVVQLLSAASETTPALLAEIGRLALAAATIPELLYLQLFAMLHGLPWPEGDLRVTAIDAHTGAFHAWGGGDGVPLASAVAASCAVPGFFPPVTIAGRRYIDGGMRSDANADLAAGYERVLVIAPIGGEAGGLAAQRPLPREMAQLRAAGAAVELIAPDAAALAAFGGNLMDAQRRSAAAQAGVRQGEAAASAIGQLWR